MSKPLSIQRLLRLGVVALVCSLLIACDASTRKLDEAPIYDGPAFRLKLVRYHENLPLHYTGEVFWVQCASSQTQNSPAHKTQDAGWVSLGNGGAIGSQNAAELAERERRHYLVINEHTLVWVGNGVNVSFDACGSFRGWYPTAIPQDLIVSAEKPDYCAPKGSADCRHYDFLGEREPSFDQIHASPNGLISFVIRSKAIRDGKSVRVESADFGKTWKITAF